MNKNSARKQILSELSAVLSMLEADRDAPPPLYTATPTPLPTLTEPLVVPPAAPPTPPPLAPLNAEEVQGLLTPNAPPDRDELEALVELMIERQLPQLQKNLRQMMMDELLLLLPQLRQP